jgi:hypothetical protein
MIEIQQKPKCKPVCSSSKKNLEGIRDYQPGPWRHHSMGLSWSSLHTMALLFACVKGTCNKLLRRSTPRHTLFAWKRLADLTPWELPIRVQILLWIWRLVTFMLTTCRYWTQFLWTRYHATIPTNKEVQNSISLNLWPSHHSNKQTQDFV